MSNKSPASVLLENMTWRDVEAAAQQGSILLVPIGSLSKAHGVHLPLASDFIAAKAIAESAAAAHGNCLVAPVVSAGYYPAFVRFPGTVSLSHSVFYGLVRETISSYLNAGFEKVFVFDYGISTNATVGLVIQDLYEQEGVLSGFTSIVNLEDDKVKAFVEQPGRHAGEQETSIMMALTPELVDLSSLDPDAGSSDEPPQIKRARIPIALDPKDEKSIHFSPEGHIGDPTQATANKGKRIIELLASNLCAALREFEKLFEAESRR